MKKICLLLLIALLLPAFVSCVRPPVLAPETTDERTKNTITAATEAPSSDRSSGGQAPDAPTLPTGKTPSSEPTDAGHGEEYVPAGTVIPDEPLPALDTAPYKKEKLDAAPVYHENGDRVPGGLPVSIRVHSVYLDGCYYYLVDNRKVWKYDLLTDLCAPACVDPGCAHNADGCISYDLSFPQDEHSCQLITADEHYLYFRAGNGIYRYDLENAHTESFAETIDHLTENVSLIPYKNAMYMTGRKLPKDGDASKAERVLIRIDKQTKKTTEVVNFGTSMDYLTAIEGDRLYINHNNIEYYTLDLSGGDRQPLLDEKWLWQCDPLVDGSCIWSHIWQFQEVYYKSCMIHRLDPARKEDRVICGFPAAKYFVTEKYIYCIPRYDNATMVKNVPVVRMDHGGGDKQVVLWLRDVNVDDFFVDGDYLFASVIVIRAGEYGTYFGDQYFYVYDLSSGAFREFEDEQWYVYVRE